MDLESLYRGSFVDWERVAGSWGKRTVSSRLLLFAARHYLEEVPSAPPDPEREATLGSMHLPEEIRRAFASPPGSGGPESRRWGEFVDAAIAAELEMVSYGERPPLLHELRSGLGQAASEAGSGTELGRWFGARRDALPGTDLPDDPGYLPV
jgi:hypothetical protein